MLFVLFKFCLAWLGLARNLGVLGASLGVLGLSLDAPRRLLERSGAMFAPFFERFRGRPGVRTKNARHAIRMRHGDRIACSALRDRPHNCPKIAPGVSRERLSEKHGHKSRVGASQAHFSVAPGRPEALRGRPKALQGRPKSSPSASRSFPGAPPKPPKSPSVAPKAPGSDLGRFLFDF